MVSDFVLAGRLVVRLFRGRRDEGWGDQVGDHGFDHGEMFMSDHLWRRVYTSINKGLVAKCVSSTGMVFFSVACPSRLL